MHEQPLGECRDTTGMVGLNISDRQVNEGALGELEAANAETGSLNGVCTLLPVLQCGDFAFYSSLVQTTAILVYISLTQAFGAWCSGV